MSTHDDVFTFRDTGYVAEHYFQKPGEPRRYYRKDYIRGVMRRAKNKGDILTDDQGARRDGGPVLRVVRATREETLVELKARDARRFGKAAKGAER